MLLRLFQPIKFPVWPLLGVLIVPSWAIGQAEQQAKTLTQMPIRVTGANDALTQNVLAWLTEPIACDADELQRQLWQRLAGKATTKALQALGYYQPAINIRFHQAQAESCPTAVVDINPRQPVVFAKVEQRLLGEGLQDEIILQAWHELNRQPGEVLHHGRYDAAKQHIAQRLQERGYNDAHYGQSQIQVDMANQQANLFMTLDTGRRYRFGEIQFNQDFLHDDFVRRYSPLASGQDFDSDKLNQLFQNLSNSGYFNDVRIRQAPANQKDTSVPIEVSLTPRNRMSYAFSAGYGSDTGERVGADIKRHWFNRRGHYGNALLQYAQRRQILETHYVVPWDNPLTEKLDWGFRAQYEENDRWGSGSFARVGPNFVRELYDGWTGVAFTELWSSRTEFIGDSPREGQFFFAGLRLLKRDSDDPIFPTDGWSLMAEVKMADPSWFSSTSLIQGRVDFHGLMPFAAGGLLLRAQAGSTWVENFDLLPKPLRFYTGGDTTVRGYAFEALAPANARGVLIGGQHYVAASVEYSHPLSESWQLATFLDIGDAFNEWELGLQELKQGAGLGVRWKTPVGYVKADMAFPISQANANEPRLHLGIGASF
ncbi:MAG: outer membrane protein assembly factor [Gammaproteobacteria bacterium]|nr:outer membrane protein assembly factor [Gammaproteobacteria bacterium]